MPRRLALAALLTTALAPMAASAQSGPTIWELFSPNRLIERALQSGIMALRTQLDLKYGGLSVDLAAGRVTITDLRAWPLPEWDPDGDCEITADRLTLRTAALAEADRVRIKAQLVGVAFPAVCLPDEPREGLAMAGLDAVAMPRLTMDFDYDVPSAGARLHLFGDVDQVAAVDLTADFAYLWVDGRDDMEEPDPVVFLKSAALSVENGGIWERLSPMLPPQVTDPANASMVAEGALGQALGELNRDAAGFDAEGDPSELSEEQRAFIATAAAAWPAFLANPQGLVVETAIDGDVYLNFEEIEDDPRVLFAALKPQVALAPAARDAMLPVALLSEALGPSGTLMEVEDRRRVGIALVTGVGAPRNQEAGFGLLNPLAKSGDGAAALAMAEALELRAPEDGYRWALIAGAAGEHGATALLDRIEARTPLEQILRLQHNVSDPNLVQPPDEALASVAAMRDRAGNRLSGVGLPRSYEIAAFWAMLASATGDAEAADILGEIDDRVRAGGTPAAQAWAAAESAASTRAMQTWIRQDMPARFAR